MALRPSPSSLSVLAAAVGRRRGVAARAAFFSHASPRRLPALSCNSWRRSLGRPDSTCIASKRREIYRYTATLEPQRCSYQPWQHRHTRSSGLRSSRACPPALRASGRTTHSWLRCPSSIRHRPRPRTRRQLPWAVRRIAIGRWLSTLTQRPMRSDIFEVAQPEPVSPARPKHKRSRSTGDARMLATSARATLGV